MRTLIRWAQSNQGCLAVTLFVGLYYVALYRPLHHDTGSLDGQLRQAWQRLEQANQDSQTQDRLDLDHISKGLRRLELSLTEITNTNQKLLSRISIDPRYQERTANPFQLIEFQNERQIIIESIGQAASAKSTTIEAEVYEGFPQHLSEQTDPQLLWAELAHTQHLVQSMIYSEVSNIHSLQTSRQEQDTSPSSLLVPFITEVAFTCRSSQLSKLLLLLPNRSSEINADLSLDYPPHKPSLFIDQVLIRKNSPQDPSKVSVWMNIISFIQLSPQGERQE